MSVSQLSVSLAGIPTPRTFDPSTGQVMPDYSEPQFSSGGCADELSAAAQRYALAKMNSYAAAHLEADTDDLLCEVDHLRTELAARDYTPQEFADVMADQCPGVIYSMTVTQYVATAAEGGAKVETRYEGWVNFPGAHTRNIPADSWRGLAEKIVAEFKMRKGLVAVPVVEVSA